MTRLLLTLLVWFGSAQAGKHRRAPLVLPNASAGNQGVKPAVLPPPVMTTPSFVATHSARVEHDLMLFQPALVGFKPPANKNVLLAKSPERAAPHYYTPPVVADDLEVRRDRDRLLLFRGPQPQGEAVALGVAMFGTATFLSAHAPRRLRALFDGPVHLGPAIFDGGGMGAGIAGRGL